MAFNGAGQWVNLFYPTQDRDNNIKILASKFEDLIQTDMKSSFEKCATVDSQTKLTANWDFNSKRGINLLDAVSRTDTPNLGQAQSGISSYAVDTGIVNAYSIVLTPAITAYSAGLTVKVKIGISNTGASTIAINGLATKDLKIAGSALESGNLKANEVYTLVYDGVNFEVMRAPVTNNDIASSFIKGCVVSNPTASLDVSEGTCRSSDNTTNIVLGAISKITSLATTWTAGAGNGCIPIGVTGPAIINTYGGTLTTVTTAVTGIGTSFLTQFVPGDFLYSSATFDYRRINKVTSNIAMVLDSGFNTAVSVGIAPVKCAAQLFVFALYNPTNKTSDVGVDNVIGATNLMADTNVIAAGFTKFRRIGVVKTNWSISANGRFTPSRFTAKEKSGGGCLSEFGAPLLCETFDGTRALDFICPHVPIGIPFVAKLMVRAFSISATTPIINIGLYSVAGSVTGNAPYISTVAWQENTVERELLTNSSGQIYRTVPVKNANASGEVWFIGFYDERNE